jgi:transmembrane 9 superfamily member 2/4
MRGPSRLFLACLIVFFSSCTCFYVPGWSPHTYRVGDTVPLFLNKVSSERTHLPYAYAELPGVCKPKNSQSVSLNLGEILRGIEIELVLTKYRGSDI